MEVFCCLLDDVNVVILLGGEKCCVVLCKLLFEVLDMLLFDEFINYFDVEIIVWL